jgi:hypothetical protein
MRQATNGQLTISNEQKILADNATVAKNTIDSNWLKAQIANSRNTQ